MEINFFQLLFSTHKPKGWKLTCRRTNLPGEKNNGERVLEAVVFSCLEFTELEFWLEVFSGVF